MASGSKVANFVDPLHTRNLVNGKAFGSKQKQAGINAATGQAVNAVTPKSYSDPYGSFNGETGSYSPNQTATQLDTRNTLDTGINNAANQLSSYSMNPLDSQVYKSTLDQLQAPVNRQYQQDQLSLQDNLNAKGLTGGSYDAYSHNLASQNHDYNLLQQQAPAMQAYNSTYQNALAGLQGLGGAQGQQTAQYYQPFDNYIRYQSALNPLQTTAANAYGNLAQIRATNPTFMDNFLKMSAAGGQTAAAAAAG